jgi:hypothetical protein
MIPTMTNAVAPPSPALLPAPVAGGVTAVPPAAGVVAARVGLAAAAVVGDAPAAVVGDAAAGAVGCGPPAAATVTEPLMTAAPCTLQK